jgi:predicted neuraminidase
MIQLPKTLPRWLSAMLFIIALGAAFWRAPMPTAPVFVPPPAATPSTLAASFTSETLPKVAEWAQAASLTQFPDGRLAAAWLAGSEAGNEANSIWFSTLGKDGWRKPLPIANRASTAGGTFAHVRRIGNPVLYAEGSWLHLWYVSMGIGGAASSTLNHSFSTDGGKSWMKPSRLQTSPFANISTLASAPPHPLADGGLGLPIHHQFIATQGEWLRLSANGKVLDKVRLSHAVPTRQPAVVALDAQRALAVLPDAGPKPGKVQIATTNDGGLRWQAGEALPVNNPDSPVAMLRLKSGRLLLAGNPASGRGSLSLWLSPDEGKTWQPSRTVETAADGGADFSHPALLLGSDGRIHLAYTWRSQQIKHAVFSEAWLDGGQP